MKLFKITALLTITCVLLSACGSDSKETSSVIDSKETSSVIKASMEPKFSLAGGTRCPLRDGEEYASSPSYAAGEVYRIISASYGNVMSGFSDCKKCAEASRREAVRAGMQVQGMGPMYDACIVLFEKYGANPSAWNALGK